MKLKTEVSDDKLRGGFYSPPELVDVCLQRVEALAAGRGALRVLEPAAGDGEFVRGIARGRLHKRVAQIDAIELVDDEARLCEHTLAVGGLEGAVHVGSFLSWAKGRPQTYDVALGNPPFLRFQFVSSDDRLGANAIADDEGISFGGVSNLWIPILIGALRLLRDGGVFAFIIPTECFTGISASVARTWLLSNCDDLRVDLFPPGSFPAVLQEVLVLSGVRRHERDPGCNTLEISEHRQVGGPRAWRTQLDVSTQNWTRCLLEPDQQQALAELSQLPFVSVLSMAAKFEVAAVTGANSFFSVDADTVQRHELEPWAVPLLPRIRHAEGLRYTAEDHERTIASGAKAFLLDFSAERPDPLKRPLPRAYLAQGVAQGLPSRFKCRIRDPWFRVPHIKRGDLMMSKRSHRYPRVAVNESNVVTTDTIYRGKVFPLASVSAADFAAAFHNSLTLLSAEIAGRSFGGGVLELVPSEIGRLLVPLVPGFGEELTRLDNALRETGGADDEALVEETDRLLRKLAGGASDETWELVSEARSALLRRRLDRSEAS